MHKAERGGEKERAAIYIMRGWILRSRLRLHLHNWPISLMIMSRYAVEVYQHIFKSVSDASAPLVIIRLRSIDSYHLRGHLTSDRMIDSYHSLSRSAISTRRLVGSIASQDRARFAGEDRSRIRSVLLLFIRPLAIVLEECGKLSSRPRRFILWSASVPPRKRIVRSGVIPEACRITSVLCPWEDIRYEKMNTRSTDVRRKGKGAINFKRMGIECIVQMIRDLTITKFSVRVYDKGKWWKLERLTIART